MRSGWGHISDKLMGLAHDGALPFGHVTAPDAVLLPAYCAEVAVDPAIRIGTGVEGVRSSRAALCDLWAAAGGA